MNNQLSPGEIDEQNPKIGGQNNAKTFSITCPDYYRACDAIIDLYYTILCVALLFTYAITQAHK